MNKTFLCLMLLFCFTACNDYIASKRDGLKPYPEHERQAEEEDQNQK